MADSAEPVSYLGVPDGVPLLSSTGTEFGTLVKVLQIPEADLFDGVIVHTHHGKRFVDRDQIDEITTAYIKCGIDDTAVESLPEPSGTPVYHADSLIDVGHSFRDWVGRTFGHGGWKREE